MDDEEHNPIFDSVSYGAAQLQQILILQKKELMLDRWRRYMDEQEGSGGRVHKTRLYKSAASVLYEELRPRMKEKQKEGYSFNVTYMDSLLSSECIDELRRLLLEYLETDLKLTKVDIKQEYDRTNILLSNKVKGLA